MSVAVHPINNNILLVSANTGDYPTTTKYGTGVYWSNDGGINWVTLKSPTKRRNKVVLMHPKDSKIIYIGAYAPPKK